MNKKLWGGKRSNCGRKKGVLPIKKDHRSEELKAKMKRNAEINDEYFARYPQPKGSIARPRFRLGKYKNTFYEGGW